MAEKESTQGLRLSLEEEEEQTEKYKSLYFRVATNTPHDWYSRSYIYEWHAISFSSSNRWKIVKLPATLQKMPPNIPESAMAVPFRSQIYLIGGIDQNRNSSANVFSFDTTHPDNGWKQCPSMIIGRKKPSSVACQGKIYVFGGNARVVYPEAEVFDPLLNKWDPLSQPPWCLATHHSHALNSDDDDGDSNKQVILGFSEYLYTYNVEADSWNRFGGEYNSVVTDRAAAVADGVRYCCSEGHKLCGFDLVNLKWFSNPVVGLEKENVFPPGDSQSPVWLLHLGGGTLCLVWYALWTEFWIIPNITVYCTTFRVSKCDNKDGEVILVANIESSALYHLSGSYCVDFIAL